MTVIRKVCNFLLTLTFGSGSCEGGVMRWGRKTHGRAVGKERNPARCRSRRHADCDRPSVGRAVPAAAQEPALSVHGAGLADVGPGTAEAGDRRPRRHRSGRAFPTARGWSSGCARSARPAAASSWPPARRANSPRRSPRISACSIRCTRPTGSTISRRRRNAQRWSRPMATAASTMPATAATTSPASMWRARRSSWRPIAMRRAGSPRTRPNCSRRRSRRSRPT